MSGQFNFLQGLVSWANSFFGTDIKEDASEIETLDAIKEASEKHQTTKVADNSEQVAALETKVSEMSTQLTELQTTLTSHSETLLKVEELKTSFANLGTTLKIELATALAKVTKDETADDNLQLDGKSKEKNKGVAVHWKQPQSLTVKQ